MPHSTENEESTFLAPGKEFAPFIYCTMRYLNSLFGEFPFEKKGGRETGRGGVWTSCD